MREPEPCSGDEWLLRDTLLCLAPYLCLLDEQLLQDTFAGLAANITAQNASIHATDAKVRPALPMCVVWGGWQRQAWQAHVHVVVDVITGAVRHGPRARLGERAA